MRSRTCRVGLVALATAMLSGCAGPKPILYPNAHYQYVGESVAQSDIEGCRVTADAAGANRDPSKVTSAARSAAAGGAIGGAAGAAGGAVVGHAGRGAGVGAASGAAAALMRALLFQRKTTSQAHISYVDRCLQDLGYEPVGWQ
ncbi:MAG: hypothetical protein JRE38_12580 [Deltaproteobacteria bacterium]|nr:hypothetical protein [Deltaproteobacteria bacterium]MBW2578885.1 hypothetical protein [Deltaproteobacteria bacterium]MBW2692431.1 hypothetical protein [Deltaproteobacteria bacterium]